MYLRTTTRRNQDGSVVADYQRAETRWDPVKRRPTAQIIHNVGRADALDRDALVRLARSITRVWHGGLDVPAEVASPGEALERAWARPLGVVHVARALGAELGISAVLRGLERPGPRRAPHALALFTMVANRLAEPLSKRACDDHWVPERVSLPEAEALTREQLYVARDFLDTHIEAVAREIFFRTADLFRADVELIFWDTTTVFFEVDPEDEADETRRGKTLPALRQELDRLDPQAPAHRKRACELVASKRCGRSLARGPGGRLAIDAAAVRRAARMDGTYVRLPNDDTLTPEDVGLGDKAMLRIEACFRRMQTTGLRIRPVSHGTAHRIASHVKLCVLALLLQRAAEIRAGDRWRNIRLVLDEIKAVRYRVPETTIVQRTRLTAQATALLQKLQVAPPKRRLAVEREPRG